MKIEDYFKYYIQGSDHYLIPKDVFKELFNEMINWKEESKQLKEKVNKLEILIENLKLGVTLNQEQEDLLDEILFRESRE
ncbi:MAG: hypothetical protein MSA65_02875 [Mollicutes bacterium]|nr:hypothetical protein [Mollicutes bacterium]